MICFFNKVIKSALKRRVFIQAEFQDIWRREFFLLNFPAMKSVSRSLSCAISGRSGLPGVKTVSVWLLNKIGPTKIRRLLDQVYWRSYATVREFWKNWLNFWKSSSPIRFNLPHAQPSLFLFALESPIWCFTSLPNHFFLGFPALKSQFCPSKIAQNIVTYNLDKLLGHLLFFPTWNTKIFPYSPIFPLQCCLAFAIMAFIAAYFATFLGGAGGGWGFPNL